MSSEAEGLLRDNLTKMYNESDPYPIETELSGGIYIGFFPSPEKSEYSGVAYIYIADTNYYFESSPPENLLTNPQLKELSSNISLILCDIFEETFELSRNDDLDSKGGVYYSTKIHSEILTKCADAD